MAAGPASRPAPLTKSPSAAIDRTSPLKVRSCSLNRLAIPGPAAITDQLYGHERIMKEVTLADAKAHLSELVERAAQGEPVHITRRGRPVARLTGVERQRKPIDIEALQALTASMPMQPEPARSWLRSVRDESRY
jgi:prevent-host-death family protein